jgi:hypothetical protein
LFGGVDSVGPASKNGELCSMGDKAVDPVPDSKRDDDLESSLVLAVPVVMVGAVLVGEV